MKPATLATSLFIGMASILAAQSSFAQNLIRILFEKGSYCVIYSGDFETENSFVLNLQAGQTVSVEGTGYGNANPNSSFLILDPFGNSLELCQSISAVGSECGVETSGDHRVIVESRLEYDTVTVCAS